MNERADNVLYDDPAAPQSRAMEIGEVSSLLWRHRVLLLVLVILGGAAGFALSRLQEPLYWAEAVIVIGREINARPAGESDEIPAEWLVGTERDIIRSRSMLEQALERLGTPPPAGAGSIPDQIAGWFSAPETPSEEPTLPEQVEQVEGGFQVDSTQGSLALTLQHASPSPDFSARFVNALVYAYVESKEEAFTAARRSALSNVEERTLRFSSEIDQTIEDMSSLVLEPNSQILMQRRRQELAGLQEILESLEMQSLNLALTPNTQRVWVVSPATVPAEPDLSARYLTIAAGLVLPAAIAAVLLIVAAQFSAFGPRAYLENEDGSGARTPHPS